MLNWIISSLLFVSSSLSDEEILMDVRDDTSTGNSSLDEHVELFVTSDGQLQVSGSDSPDFEVLWGVTG